MVVRWLLPLVAVIALLGNAVSAFAAAGIIGDSACCCPDPKTCKCHDHDHPRPAAELKRCSGEAHKATPHLQVIVIPDVVEEVLVLAEQPIVHVALFAFDQYIAHPEKPPF